MSLRPLGHNSLSPLSQTGSLMRTPLGHKPLQLPETLGNYLQAYPLVIPNSNDKGEQSWNFTSDSSLQGLETNFVESADVGEGVEQQISQAGTANSPQIQTISENPPSETMEAIASLKPLGLPKPLGHTPLSPQLSTDSGNANQVAERFVSPRLETIQPQLTSETTLENLIPRESVEVQRSISDLPITQRQVEPDGATSQTSDTQIQPQPEEIPSPEITLPQSSRVPPGQRSDRALPERLETNLPSPEIARKSDLENPTPQESLELQRATSDLPVTQRQFEPNPEIDRKSDLENPTAQESVEVQRSTSDVSVTQQKVEPNMATNGTNASHLVSQQELAQDLHTTTALPTPTVEPTTIQASQEHSVTRSFADEIDPLQEATSNDSATSQTSDPQIQPQAEEILPPEITLPQSSRVPPGQRSYHPLSDRVETNLPSPEIARKSDLEHPTAQESSEVQRSTSDVPVTQRQVEPNMDGTNASHLVSQQLAQDLHTTTALPTTVEPTIQASQGQTSITRSFTDDIVPGQETTSDKQFVTPQTSDTNIQPKAEEAILPPGQETTSDEQFVTSQTSDTNIQPKAEEIPSPEITLPESSRVPPGQRSYRAIPDHSVETNLPSPTKSSLTQAEPTSKNINLTSLEATPELHLDKIPSPVEPNIVQKTQIEIPQTGEPQQPTLAPEQSTIDDQVEPTPIISSTSLQQPQTPTISTKPTTEQTDADTTQPIHIPSLLQRQTLGLSPLATTPDLTSQLSDDSFATPSVQQKDSESNSHTNPVQPAESLDEAIQPALLSPTQPKPNQNVAKNTPDSWSNITELLGDPTHQTNAEPWEEQFNLQSPITEELISPWAKDTSPNPDKEGKTSPGETLISPLATSDAQLSPHQATKNSAVDEEQFELLAQTVYRLMRFQFAADRERYNHTSTGYLPWIDVIHLRRGNNTSSSTMASNSYFSLPIEGKLSTLTYEVYQKIKIRLEVARER